MFCPRKTLVITGVNVAVVKAFGRRVLTVTVVSVQEDEELFIFVLMQPLNRLGNASVKPAKLAFLVEIGVKALVVPESSADAGISCEPTSRVSIVFQHFRQRHQIWRKLAKICGVLLTGIVNRELVGHPMLRRVDPGKPCHGCGDCPRRDRRHAIECVGLASNPVQSRGHLARITKRSDM